MARDRLAPRRNQPQSSSPTAFEMSSLSQSYAAPSTSAADFFADVTSVRQQIDELNACVARISDLHARKLGESVASATAEANSRALNELVGETRVMATRIKDRVAEMQRAAAAVRGQDARVRMDQIKLLRERLLEALQSYRRIEQDYEKKYKERVERQFTTVKPDATPEEIKAVVESGGGDQIFMQALMSSTRYGEGRAAYREVQTRHQELQKIENTLVELTQLFTDIELLVEQQGEVISQIESNAGDVSKDLEKGDEQLEKAREHARRARRLRIICFFITLIIIIAVVLIVLGSIGVFSGKFNH